MSTLQLCGQSFEQDVEVDPVAQRAAGRVLVTAARNDDERRLFLQQIGLLPIDMDRIAPCGHARHEIRLRDRSYRCRGCARERNAS